MKLETPPTFKGREYSFGSFSDWLSGLVDSLKRSRIYIGPAPMLLDFSDNLEWQRLSNWLSLLHGKITRPFAHNFTTVSKSATETLTVEESGFVFLDATVAAFTLTLPPAAKMGAGGWFWFVKTDVTTNAITLDGSGSETINGSTSINYLDAQYEYCAIISNGSNWIIILSSWLP